ncbi:MAG: hypothetical protein ABI837_09015 [Acidobacteriota bacterium]
MEKGREFLRAQVNNGIMLHQTLLRNLEDHAKQAEDSRYRELCERYLLKTRDLQRSLSEYGETIGADAKGGVKGAIGAVLGMARDAVDSLRETDFLRLVGDIVTMRQAQDTFATFAAVGDRINEKRLAEIGRNGEREHDEMQREFNQLVQSMFVAHVQGSATTSAEARPEVR